MENGVYLSEELMEKLRLRSDVHDVRPLRHQEINFLKELGIEYNSSNLSVELLKHNVATSAQKGQVWVDRCKEMKCQVTEYQIKTHIEEFFDLFSQIVSPSQLPIIINVLQNALSFEMSESSQNSTDFSIYACKVSDQKDWSICVFHIKASQSSSFVDMLLNFFGQKKLSLHFLGYHLRQI